MSCRPAHPCPDRRGPDMVREFMEKMGYPVGGVPLEERAAWADQRRRLLREEVHELAVELARVQCRPDDREALLGVAREAADVVYVAIGAMVALGVDAEAVLAEVHRANMAKKTPRCVTCGVNAKGHEIGGFQHDFTPEDKPRRTVPPDVDRAVGCVEGWPPCSRHRV